MQEDFTIGNWSFRLLRNPHLNLVYEGPRLVKGFLSAAEVDRLLSDPFSHVFPFPKYTRKKLVRKLRSVEIV